MTAPSAELAACLTDVRARIRAADAAGTPLRLSGGGTKDFYGQSLEGEPLDLRGYAGIVDYDPTELVVTARCGTPLDALERALFEQGQFLACEPPHFGPGSTVGGMVAAGLSGPRRQAAGSVRDFVLGARLMDAGGEVLTFGGQVMKNVAGYDVSRVLAGSMGVLGVILEVSLKTLPLAPAEATVRLELPEARAIDQMNRWAARPIAISACAYVAGDLWVRLSGADAAVRSGCERIGGDRVIPIEADAFWRSVRDHREPLFQGTPPLWRVSVPSTTPPLGLPGEQLIEWGGALRWIATDADARTIRDAATTAGGHATLFRGGDKSVGVFHPLDPVLARLNANLKSRFDPKNIFNRHRTVLQLLAPNT